MFVLAKIQNGRQWPEKIVAYEEFNIYSFVIPLFHLIFHGELISVFCLQKYKMAPWYNTEIVTYEEIQIYLFVIIFFSIIFHEKLNSGSILPFQSFCHCTI